MKLASLAYEICRDAIEFPSGFNKEGFVRGDYDSDRDFNSQISFVFNYINLAFSRLFTSKKLHLKVANKISNDAGYIEFEDGEVTAVIDSLSADYNRVLYLDFADGLAVEAQYARKSIFVEYRPFIPHFSLESIRDQQLDEDNHPYYEEIEIDLEDYGISDDMCNYVKEYAKGGLLEYLSPELSQKHTQMAESYFASLKTRHTAFPPNKVTNRYAGEW